MNSMLVFDFILLLSLIKNENRDNEFTINLLTKSN